MKLKRHATINESVTRTKTIHEAVTMGDFSSAMIDFYDAIKEYAPRLQDETVADLKEAFKHLDKAWQNEADAHGGDFTPYGKVFENYVWDGSEWDLTDEDRDAATKMMADRSISPNDWSEEAIGVGLMFSEPTGIWSKDKVQFYNWLDSKEGDFPKLDKQLKQIATKYLKNIDYSK